jgi:hypothetical protein
MSEAYDGMHVVGTVHHGWIVLGNMTVVAKGFGWCSEGVV